MRWRKCSEYNKEPKRLVVKTRDSNLSVFQHTGTEISQISLTDQYEYFLDESTEDQDDRDNFAIGFAAWSTHHPDAQGYKAAGITAYDLLQKYKSRPFINPDTSKQ